MKALYTAEVVATGGRDGEVKSQSSDLTLDLAIPESMGGDGSAGTNPEELFAAAYGPCFLGALKSVAKKAKVEIGNPRIVVKVSFNEEGGEYTISAGLNVVDESVEDEILNELVKKTHQVCPYSKAIRGNVDVVVTANKREVEA